VAGREDQAQQVVADEVVEPAVGVRRVVLEPVFDLARNLVLLAGVQRAAAQEVDRPVPGRGHQPRGRLLGNAGGRPPFQRDDERVLRQFLGQANVAHDAREAGDDLGGFHLPDCGDGAPRRVVIRGGLI
jgi:hypothetical protein